MYLLLVQLLCCSLLADRREELIAETAQMLKQTIQKLQQAHDYVPKNAEEALLARVFRNRIEAQLKILPQLLEHLNQTSIELTGKAINVDPFFPQFPDVGRKDQSGQLEGAPGPSLASAMQVYGSGRSQSGSRIEPIKLQVSVQDDRVKLAWSNPNHDLVDFSCGVNRVGTGLF